MVSIITSCLRVPAMRSRHPECATAPVAITDRLDAGKRCLLKVNFTQLALQPPYPPAHKVRVRAWLAAFEVASTAASLDDILRQHCHHENSLVNWFMSLSTGPPSSSYCHAADCHGEIHRGRLKRPSHKQTLLCMPTPSVGSIKQTFLAVPRPTSDSSRRQTTRGHPGCCSSVLEFASHDWTMAACHLR
jgi:hypothetical protein